MKWKNVTAASVALMISLSCTASFNDGLDTGTVDLMQTALKSQPVEERKSFCDLLKLTLYDAATTLNRNGMISLNIKYETKSSTDVSVFTPTEEDNQTLPDKGIALEKPVLGFKTEFNDMTKHWSTSYVTLLTRAGVIADFPVRLTDRSSL